MKKIINLYIPLIIIVTFSLITLYDYNFNYFIKQCIWLLFGFGIVLLSKHFKLNRIFKYSKYIYIFNVILLVLVLFFGKEINGSKAWFDFKLFSFQPSELMKLSIALYLTNIFKEKNKFYFIKAIIVVIIPSLLVFFEPDTGAIIMYLVIYLSALFFSLKNKKIFFLFGIIGMIFLGIFIWLYFKNIDILVKILGTSIFYRIDRIINFKNNYQLQNALICIGTTGFWGRNNKPMIYIPESVTDFMFARVISIFGLISGIILIICYFFILTYIILLLKKGTNKIFIFSFLWLFLFQIIQNVFMNIGLLPIMGIPLPFLSYGGSNTIIYFLLLAVTLRQEKSN